MALLRTRTFLPTRPRQKHSTETQIDKHIGATSGSSAFRQVEQASVLVRKAAFADSDAELAARARSEYADGSSE